MKYFIISMLISLPVFADSLELIGGGLTYHFFDNPEVSELFDRKVSPDGALIANPLIGLGYYNYYDQPFYYSFKFFGGSNSIGCPMIGATGSWGVENNGFELGVVLGGYLQDSSEFSKRGIPLIVGDFMPIAGFEINKKFKISDTAFIKVNNLVTAAIYNLSFSIGNDF